MQRMGEKWQRHGEEACDEVVAWAGVKADDGDGMDVTFGEDTEPKGRGALL